MKKSKLEIIILSIIFYFFEFKYWIKNIKDYYISKNIYFKLKREELACLYNFQDGSWTLDDKIALNMFNEIKIKLKRFSNEKYYTENIIK